LSVFTFKAVSGLKGFFSHGAAKKLGFELAIRQRHSATVPANSLQVGSVFTAIS
jgi:hypothetical protein